MRTPKLSRYRLFEAPPAILFYHNIFCLAPMGASFHLYGSFMGYLRFFLFLFLSLGIDQLFKLVLTPLFLGWSFFIFPFSITVQETLHEPFDFLGLPSPIVTCALVIFIFIFEYIWYKTFKKYRITSFWMNFFWGILSGGMISNGIDRMVYGSVKNIFLISSVGSFNFADIFIIVGACGLFLFLWWELPYNK